MKDATGSLRNYGQIIWSIYQSSVVFQK